jgi:glycosyltransferase involved in cell wall biosynthesis
MVLSCGRIWDEAKNIQAVCRAAVQCRWPVFVAGDNRHPNGDNIEARNVRALGILSPEELATWYGRAAIFALPACYEPFGLAALEAGLAGCALVLGDIPSLREVWGGSALFVPPDDSDALAWRIGELVENPALLQQFREKARARALHYSSSRMSDAYLNVYASLLGKPDLETACA